MTLQMQDWINIVIAAGTCGAAIASWRAATSAKTATERSELLSKKHADNENIRWLTTTLLDITERCNKLVSSNGILSDAQADLSLMISNIHDTINLIHDYSETFDGSAFLKKTLWSFLHTSIRAELKSRDKLEKWNPAPDGMILYPDAEEYYSLTSKQYKFVETNLVNIVGNK